MLTRVIDGVLDQRYNDVTIVPVSITYDRLVETDAHVDELSGGRKRAERLFPTVTRLSSILTSAATSVTTFGRVDVRIAEPFSLIDYLRDSAKHDGSLDLASGTKQQRVSLADVFSCTDGLACRQCTQVPLVQRRLQYAVSLQQRIGGGARGPRCYRVADTPPARHQSQGLGARRVVVAKRDSRSWWQRTCRAHSRSESYGSRRGLTTLCRGGRFSMEIGGGPQDGGH